uniref:PPIase cyclophilin-type domain-containing protein n=1 Tax=Davidia involucrata TaxID=16924 RepID=A0A5B7BAE5_DAVIN
MGRRQVDSELGRCAFLVLLLMGLVSCSVVYVCFSVAVRPSTSSLVENGGLRKEDLEKEDRECCRGIEHLELWGDAVKWGSDFKVNSSEKCCRACKEMCKGEDGPCLCDSWVFCGDREACGPRFGECWLKKQKDILDPVRRDSGQGVIWTSGLVFGKGKGTVGLKTNYGVLHVKLFPDCAPHSVTYILELLASRHCAGCQFYRAESRGSSWDSEGNHIENAPLGPPFALIQGTLEAHGTIFQNIPKEDCPAIRRGSVAWVGSGPDFFISLAKHNEWRKAYTVFGSVLPEDIEIAEKIAQLPTVPESWSNINVSVLKKPVPLQFQRIETSLEI